jgi:hypothetical protein
MIKFDASRVGYRVNKKFEFVYMYSTTELFQLPLWDFEGDHEGDIKWGTAGGFIIFYEMEGIEPDWRPGESFYHDCPPEHFMPGRFSVAHVARIEAVK